MVMNNLNDAQNSKRLFFFIDGILRSDQSEVVTRFEINGSIFPSVRTITLRRNLYYPIPFFLFNEFRP